MTTEPKYVEHTLAQMKDELEKLLSNYKKDIDGFWGLFSHGPTGYKRAIKLKKLINNANEITPEIFFMQLCEFYNEQNAFSSTLVNGLELKLEKFLNITRPSNYEEQIMAANLISFSHSRRTREHASSLMAKANQFRTEFKEKAEKVFEQAKLHQSTMNQSTMK